MKGYRLTIEPRTSFRTPLQSDTIWGHLMWALRYLEGEGALLAFLKRYRGGDPPVLVSAGFPTGTLPLPVLQPRQATPTEEEEGQDAFSLSDLVVGGALRKALEEERYLPLVQWREMAGRLSAKAVDEAREEAREALRHLREAQQMQPVTRTAVDRVTGSAREAQLFVSDETFFEPGHRIDVWHKVADESLLPRLERWWQWMEANGFGQRKSAGHGAFDIQGEGLVEASGELPEVIEPNGFVSLSAWVPKRADPTNVTYRTRVKRGKLAETLALRNPWKKPLLMLEPGAVARLPEGEAPSEWYGGLVEEMHWAYEGIVQYGYAYPLPVHVKGGA